MKKRYKAALLLSLMMSVFLQAEEPEMPGMRTGAWIEGSIHDLEMELLEGVRLMLNVPEEVTWLRVWTQQVQGRKMIIAYNYPISYITLLTFHDGLTKIFVENTAAELAVSELFFNDAGEIQLHHTWRNDELLDFVARSLFL